MKGNDHSDIFEARAGLEGLQAMLSNMGDQEIENLTPYQLLMLLAPITNKLNKVLEDR